MKKLIWFVIVGLLFPTFCSGELRYDMQHSRDEIIAKFKESLPKYLGHDKLLSQKDLDQGDTAQRIGTLTALLSLVPEEAVWEAFETSGHPIRVQAYDILQAEWGIYRRNSDPNSWGSRPNNLSRDQLSILKVGMVAMGDTPRLRNVAIRQALRLGFHQNTHPGTDVPDNMWKIPDIMSPGEISVYNRGFIGQLSVIPNFFIDMLLGVDLLLRKDDNWDQDNMLAINLLLANQYHPTIWSKMAMNRYLKTNFMERLWNYHKGEDNNGCEPLYWLFRLAFLDLYGFEPKDAP